MKKGKISDRLSVGGQPTEDDLRSLKADGFAAVINLRRHGEDNQPLDPAAQGAAAARTDLKYFHIPVDSSDPKREQVEAVRAAINQVDGPVYVHCQGGGRAATMALLAAAPAGSKVADVMAQSAAAGFPMKPAAAGFVTSVLDARK
jgi:sulfide:quinone oxidoreductase